MLSPTSIFVPVLAAAALLAAGCGGEETPAAEEWAGDLCSTVAAWQTEIQTITQETAQALSSPATARPALEQAVGDGLQATQDLAEDLMALEPLASPEGKQAKQELDEFLTAVESAAGDVRKALAALPEAATLTEAITSLSALGVQFQTTLEQGQQLVTTLRGLGGEVRGGFENADACRDLRS